MVQKPKSTASPTPWPKRSLTGLEPVEVEQQQGASPCRAIASAAAPAKARRLRTPVSASVEAAMRCSRAPPAP